MKKTIILACIVLGLSKCSVVKHVGEYPMIVVYDNFGDYQRLYCSDFFSSIELIPLETNNSFLVGDRPSVLAHDSLIFICSDITKFVPFQKTLFVYDISGKFLNQIGKIGRGPGEYMGISDFFINHEKSTIYVNDQIKISEYEFNGKFIGSFPSPIVDGKRLWDLDHFEYNLFVGSTSYYHGSEYKYCLFNWNGDIVKGFPSYINFKNPAHNRFVFAVPPFKVDGQFFYRINVYGIYNIAEKSNVLLNTDPHLQKGKIFGKGFIFVVHSSDFKRFDAEVSFYKFDYPIIYDYHNSFDKLNKFPPAPYRTFLLDKDNKVQLIGSPINNPQIWELYKKVMLN